jgi:hypothetical protein
MHPMSKKFASFAGALGLVVFFLSGCGGQGALANLFTPTRTPTITLTFTPSPTDLPSETPSPLPPTLTPSEVPSVTPTETETPLPTDTITPGPSPTASKTPTITRTATRTRPPTLTRTPSRTPTITFTPTITLTPTPPQPSIQILHPGLLSRLISPIQAEIIAVPGDDGLVRVELIGEDGRLIVRQAQNFSDYKNRSIAFYPSIPFEIKSMAETARLQVITNDQYGRVISIMSVDVVLLSVGRAEVFAPLITQEPFIIRFPNEGDAIPGAGLMISGLIRPINNSPVSFDLIAENGAVLVTKQIVVEPPSGDISHTPFLIELPCKVDGPTPVRLSIHQEGSRIPGTVALSSLLLTLEP